MNTLEVMCISHARDKTFYRTYRFRSFEARDDCSPRARSAQLFNHNEQDFAVLDDSSHFLDSSHIIAGHKVPNRIAFFFRSAIFIKTCDDKACLRETP